MTRYLLSISRRVRRTPFTDKVNFHGVKSYTVYNRMLLPTVFSNLEDDYHHLKSHVQVWDVSCERQIDISGPEADYLMQILTPRFLGAMAVGQCLYIPVVDEQGHMLNDPVALKLADDHFRISIADSDLLLWVKGLACGLKLNVRITEPEVYPLAVQGPKSDDLVARIFGEAVRDIGFFRFAKLPFKDHSFIISRSGYSKQGGFEIYVDSPSLAEPLWDALFMHGQDLNVRPGSPNLIERIEAGLLSFGNDMDQQNTPFECGLGKFCKPHLSTSCVGDAALKKTSVKNPTRQIRSLSIAGLPLAPCLEAWPVYVKNKPAGVVTSAVWSPGFNTNVALAMIEQSYWEPGSQLEIQTPSGIRSAIVQAKSFI